MWGNVFPALITGIAGLPFRPTVEELGTSAVWSKIINAERRYDFRRALEQTMASVQRFLEKAAII
ncbi:MAG: hypothetical protein FJY85_04680 [Deltaproteobacteria bacterium]|nr:hypothetical protein [Deltaproteobacteria bacterium]